MTLAPYVQAMGRGPGRARSLDLSEAEDAMRLILSGRADPHAIGALLMLMRYRGETPAEIAGFARAIRATLPAVPQADLDWPSYAAGRRRGLPWFLLAARLVAQSGVRVLLHGWNAYQSDGADLRAALAPAGIARAESLAEAARHLDQHSIAYLPLEVFAPHVLHLLSLREALGLRSCMNTVCRVMNPALAPAAVQGVFHPPYRALQQAAGEMLGQQGLCILKGGGGEFECNPGKDVTLFRLRGGHPVQTTLPSVLADRRELAPTPLAPSALAALWSGQLRDEAATAIVTATTACALISLGHAPETAQTRARALWMSRLTPPQRRHPDRSLTP